MTKTEKTEKTPRLSEDQTRESDHIESLEQSIMTPSNNLVSGKIEEIKDVLSKITDQTNSRDFESLTDPDHITLLAYLDQSIAYLSPKTPSLSDFESLVSSLEETAVSLRRLSIEYQESIPDQDFVSQTWKTMIQLANRLSSLSATLRHKVKESEEYDPIPDPEIFSLQTGDNLVFLNTSESWTISKIEIDLNIVHLYNPYSETRTISLDTLQRLIVKGSIVHNGDHDPETEETEETEETPKTYDHNWLDSGYSMLQIMNENNRVKDLEKEIEEKTPEIEDFETLEDLEIGDRVKISETGVIWSVTQKRDNHIWLQSQKDAKLKINTDLNDRQIWREDPETEEKTEDPERLTLSGLYFTPEDLKTEDPNSDPESEIFTLEIGDRINSKFHILTIWRVSEIDPESETVSLHNDLTGESLGQSFGSLLTSYKICLLEILTKDGRKIIKDYRDNTVLKIGDRLSSEDFTKRSKTWKDRDFGSLSDRLQSMIKETDGLLSFYLRTLKKTEEIKDSDSDDLYLDDLIETLEDFESDSKTIRSFGLEIERRSQDPEDSEKDYLDQFSEVLIDTLFSISTKLYILSSTEDPEIISDRVSKIGQDLIFVSRITEETEDPESLTLIDNIWLSSNIWSKDPEDWKTSKTMRETVSIIRDLIKYLETLTLERVDLTIMDSLIVIALYRGLKDLIDTMSESLSDQNLDLGSFSISDSEIVSRYLILISSLGYLHSDLVTISDTRDFDSTIETYTRGLTFSLTRVKETVSEVESVFETKIEKESDLDRVFQGLEIVSLTSVSDLLSTEKREIVRDLIDTIESLEKDWSKLEETEDLIETVSLLFRLVYLQGQYRDPKDPEEIEKDDLETLRKTQDQIGDLSIRLQSQIFSLTPEKDSETADLEDFETLTPESVRQTLKTLRDDLNSETGDSEVFRLEIISDRLFGIGQDLKTLIGLFDHGLTIPDLWSKDAKERSEDFDQYNLIGDLQEIKDSIRLYFWVSTLIDNSGHDMTKINTQRLTRRLTILINLLTQKDPEEKISEVLISIAKIGQSESKVRSGVRVFATKIDTLIDHMNETRSRLFDGRLYNVYAKDSEERDRLFETLEEIEDLESEIERLTRVSEDLIVRVYDLPYSFYRLADLGQSDIETPRD